MDAKLEAEFDDKFIPYAYHVELKFWIDQHFISREELKKKIKLEKAVINYSDMKVSSVAWNHALDKVLSLIQPNK